MSIEYGSLRLALLHGHITRAEAHLILDLRVELNTAKAMGQVSFGV